LATNCNPCTNSLQDLRRNVWWVFRSIKKFCFLLLLSIQRFRSVILYAYMHKMQNFDIVSVNIVPIFYFLTLLEIISHSDVIILSTDGGIMRKLFHWGEASLKRNQSLCETFMSPAKKLHIIRLDGPDFFPALNRNIAMVAIISTTYSCIIQMLH